MPRWFLSPFACVPGVPAAISGFSYGPAIGIRGLAGKKDVRFQLDSGKNRGPATNSGIISIS